jgi:hypothetical protein
LEWTDVSQVRTASVIKAMIHRTSETSVHSNEIARRYIPEDSKLKSGSAHLAFVRITGSQVLGGETRLAAKPCEFGDPLE